MRKRKTWAYSKCKTLQSENVKLKQLQLTSKCEKLDMEKNDKITRIREYKTKNIKLGKNLTFIRVILPKF